MGKTLKSKEKEIHNLDRNVSNLRETVAKQKLEITALKLQESKLVAEARKLKKQNKQRSMMSVSTQTLHCIDTPYSILEPLPPIFGSKLCIQTKAPFMTKSLMNLASLRMVNVTEEELLLEAAEEALRLQYDREVENFYKKAKDKARRLRDVDDEPALAMLFEQV